MQSFNILLQRNLITRVRKPDLISDTDSAGSSSFKFTNFDCIGFDLDNTICKYKVGPMLKMEYEVISNYLVKEKNYPGTHLLRPIEENIDFLIKGLILDFDNGNLLKLNYEGKILHASHGTKHLTQGEVEKLYSKDSHWNVTDVFANNPLATWNGPLSEKMRALLDYFDMPTGLIFARLVDTLDEVEGKRLAKYNLWPDILSALNEMYGIDQFKNNKGGYFPQMKEHPDRYIEKCNPKLISWLRTLKAQNKILFLITGSYMDFASMTSSTCMGENWKELFDVVIFFAKKPGFFADNRPFLSAETSEQISSEQLKKGGWYVQGNYKDLSKLLSNLSGKTNPRVAYIGDNLIQDVYTPAIHATCQTVAIVEELQAEGVFGFDSDHDHSDYLLSDRWGSFFGDLNSNDGCSIWLNMILKHASLCAPSMEFIGSNPIDFEYKM